MTRHVVFGTGQVGRPVVQRLAAHDRGPVDVAIARASGYVGPGTVRSALGDTVFAAGLITLGSAPQAAGGIWHLPVATPRTTRQIIELVDELAHRRPRALAAGPRTIRLLGLVKPELREYLHTLYQFTAPWVVDDSKFRAAFGTLPTPLGTALTTTLDWYRTTASQQATA